MNTQLLCIHEVTKHTTKRRSMVFSTGALIALEYTSQSHAFSIPECYVRNAGVKRPRGKAGLILAPSYNYSCAPAYSEGGTGSGMSLPAMVGPLNFSAQCGGRDIHLVITVLKL